MNAIFRPSRLRFASQIGEVIRHRLAGMTEVRQPVDDGNAGEARHLLDHHMREGANHDALDHALQVFGHVVHGLAFAQVDLGGREIDGKPAHLLDANIKSYPGAQRRFLEDHRQSLAPERPAVGGRVGFHLAAKNQQVLNLRGREISNREKIFAIHIPAPARAGSCSCENLTSISAKPGLVSSSTS